MSGQWKWKIKAYWPLKDFRNGTTGFLLSGKWIFFSFLLAVVFSPPLWSQCARGGYGSDDSSSLLWIQGLASYQHEFSRAGKLTWSMLYWNLEGGPWRKGRGCCSHYCTSWQSFGWLHSKSSELVSAIFFPVFPLNKQTKKQKCSFCPFTVFGFTLAPFANALHNLDWTIMVFVFKGRTRSKKLMIYSGGCCFSFISSIKYWGRTNTTKLIYNVKCMEWHELNATMLNCVTTGEINK